MYFNNGFKFLNSVWNGCHDLTIFCLNLRDIAIMTVKGIDYRCIIHAINKSETIQLLENYLPDCRGYI